MFEETREFLEKQYPNWNFKWQTVGNQIVGFCPHHGDTHKPNLYVANKGEGEFFKCFACGFSGKTGYLQNNPQVKALYSPELLKVFTITNRLATYFVDNLTSDALKKVDADLVDKAKDYLNTRNPQLFNYIKDKVLVGLLPRFFKTKLMIDFFHLTADFDGLSPKIQKQILSIDNYAGCMVFIYTDIRANAVTLKFRNFLKEDINRSNKQVFTLKFADGAFNLSNIVDQDSEYRFVYIVEGEFDVLTPIAFFNVYNDEMMRELNDKYLPEIDITQEDLNKVVGAGSVDNIHRVTRILLDNGYTPILLPDFDEAGQKGIVNVIKTVDKAAKDKEKKALDNIFAVYKRPLNVKGKDLDEIFLIEDNPRFMFFNTIQPVSLREIQVLVNKVQQDTIFNKVKELPANLQVPFLQSQGIKMPFKDNFIDVNPIINEKIEIPKIKWNGLFPAGSLSLIVGEEGSGKTYFALWYAMQMAISNRKVLFWTTEDVQETFWVRGRTIKQKVFSNISAEALSRISQNLFINLSEPEYFIKAEGYPIQYQRDDELINYLKNQNFDIILLDPLSFFYGFEENNITAAQSFMRALKQIVKNTDTSLILIHHINKEAQKEKANATKNNEDFEPNKYMIRGSSGFSAHVRHIIFINRKFIKISNTMELHAWIVKSNFVKENKIETGLPNNDRLILDVTNSNSNSMLEEKEPPKEKNQDQNNYKKSIYNKYFSDDVPEEQEQKQDGNKKSIHDKYFF